ncbi:MAG: MBL fold metallo-hydrolase [Spirochaetales bacterium]|nr:MBL fold metallo-hydrolase [Spirochaetales bacterium]
MDTTISVKAFSLGSWMTNCYVIFNRSTASCCVVDAGFDPEPMIDFILQEGLSCEKLFLTHSHLDHIAGVRQLLHAWPDMEVLIHSAEEDFLTDPVKNLSADIGMALTAPEATGALRHGDEVEASGLILKVLHTPGHSPGGICLYSREASIAFVGDTIFHGSVGRYDFPSSDGEALFAAIREHILTLPEETRIFPGHGPDSTVGHEKKTNPFLNDYR